MLFRTMALAITLSIAVIGSAQTNEIYKRVDADGNVHYGDRPSGDPGEEVMAIQSRPTDPAQVQQQVQARHDEQAAAAEAAAAAPQGPSREELAAEAEERQQKCNEYTQRLETYIEKRHLYREEEDGGRYYLTEEEMMQAQDDVSGKIDEFCNN
jgi:hypothetical protein